MPFAEPGVKPHYAPSRSVRITHIDLRLSLEPVQKTFRGEAVLHVQPLLSYDGRVVFDLDEVEVLAVTDARGEELSYGHQDGQLTVRQASPSVIKVTWQGESPRCGLYFTGPTEQEPERQHMAWTQCQDEDGHFVFPCHDHPGVRHTWSIHLDAPSGYTLLSNGACVSHEERDGRAHAHYEMRDSMPPYLFTAVAALLTCVDSEWRGRPVRYFVPVGQEEAVLRSMAKTPLMIEEYSRVPLTF